MTDKNFQHICIKSADYERLKLLKEYSKIPILHLVSDAVRILAETVYPDALPVGKKKDVKYGE